MRRAVGTLALAGALTALDFYSKVFKVKRPNLGTIVDQST